MIILGAIASSTAKGIPLTGDVGFFRWSWGDLKYFNFATNGEYATFGNLSTGSGIGDSQPCGGVCNTTRLVVMGGYQQSTGNSLTTMWYADIATKNNGASFGSLGTARYAGGQFNSATRGIAYAGYLTAAIEYITIATTGNATSFGNARQPDYLNGGGCSTTRGLSWGSQYGGQNIWIDYITIATTGNYTNFGSMSQVSNNVGCGASSTRCIGAGINSTSISTATNEYVTIATTGNSTSFGNLSIKVGNIMTSAKASTIMLCAGGYNGSANVTQMQYFTIATTGNGTTWGTLASAQSNYGGGGTTSTCHGGI